MSISNKLGIVPPGSGLAVRADFNEVDAAIATDFSGDTPPGSTLRHMTWRDTIANAIKWRNTNNDGWEIWLRYDATTAPAATNDIASGYMQGSRWLDATAHKNYECTNPAVGGAVWKEVGVGTGGGGGAVASVFGRTGTVVQASGDYTAAQITETAAAKIMTSSERTKLSGIADGAQVNPTNLDGVPDSASRLAMTTAERSKLTGIESGAQVNPAVMTDDEVVAGLATTPKVPTALQLRLAVETHGTGSGGGGSGVAGWTHATTTPVVINSGGAATELVAAAFTFPADTISDGQTIEVRFSAEMLWALDTGATAISISPFVGLRFSTSGTPPIRDSLAAQPSLVKAVGTVVESDSRAARFTAYITRVNSTTAYVELEGTMMGNVRGSTGTDYSAFGSAASPTMADRLIRRKSITGLNFTIAQTFQLCIYYPTGYGPSASGTFNDGAAVARSGVNTFTVSKVDGFVHGGSGMTAAERLKLNSVEAGAQANYPGMSDAEVQAGTSTALRTPTPKQLRDAVLAHAPAGGGGGGSLGPVVVVSATSWSPASTIATGTAVVFSSASQVAVTLPADASDDIPDSVWFVLHAAGAGGVVVSGGAGTFFPSGPITLTQHESVILRKTGLNTFRVDGNSGGGTGGGGSVAVASVSEMLRRRDTDIVTAVPPGRLHKALQSYRSHSSILRPGLNIANTGNHYTSAPFFLLENSVDKSEAMAKSFYTALATAGCHWVSFRFIWGATENAAPSSSTTLNATSQTVVTRTMNQVKWATECGLFAALDFHTLFNSGDQRSDFMAPAWIPLGTASAAVPNTRTMMNLWGPGDTATRDEFSSYQKRVINFAKNHAGWEHVRFISCLNEPYLYYGGAEVNQQTNTAPWNNTLTYIVNGIRSVCDKPIIVRFLQDWNPSSWDLGKKYDTEHTYGLIDGAGCNAYSEAPYYSGTCDELIQEGRTPMMLHRMSTDLRRRGKQFYITELNWGSQGSWTVRFNYFRMLWKWLKALQPDGIFIWLAQPDTALAADKPKNLPLGGGFNTSFWTRTTGQDTGTTAIAPYARWALWHGLANRQEPADPPHVYRDEYNPYGDLGWGNEYDTTYAADNDGTNYKQAPVSASLSAATGTAVTMTANGGSMPFLPSDIGRRLLQVDAAGVPNGGVATLVSRSTTGNSGTINISTAFTVTNLVRHNNFAASAQARWCWGDFKLHAWASERIIHNRVTVASQYAIPGDVFSYDTWIEIYNFGAAITFKGINGMSLRAGTGVSLTLPAGTATVPTVARLSAIRKDVLTDTSGSFSERVSEMMYVRIA